MIILFCVDGLMAFMACKVNLLKEIGTGSLKLDELGGENCYRK